MNIHTCGRGGLNNACNFQVGGGGFGAAESCVGRRHWIRLRNALPKNRQVPLTLVCQRLKQYQGLC
eukprot:2964296-Amphidinium_carterae.1